ncbi:MAG: tetratricopeptide repeat protein [Candidatus Hodarchaeales archaeon]|jgi:hypothetical protein
MQEESIVTFKFKYVIEGQTQGFRSKMGSISKSALWLEDMKIPYEYIVDTAIRDNRIILTFSSVSDVDETLRDYLINGGAFALEVSKLPAFELKKHIDRLSSVIHTGLQKQHLITKGRGDLFKSFICPNCKATVDLSELEETVYIYCRFCESFLTQNIDIINTGDNYRICHECHMFGYVQSYTDFQFYLIFLLIVYFYGFSHTRRYLCSVDAVKMAKRNFLKNLIFLIGVPTAILTWIKALRAKDDVFKGLSKANSFARDGNYHEADKIYSQLLEHHSNHPAILMNQAKGHLRGLDASGAIELLNKSVKACSNYYPSLRLLNRVSQDADFFQKIRSITESRSVKESITDND